MTWANRARLFFGMLMVIAITGASTIVFNQRQLQSTSLTATIESESYSVGTEYGGMVVRQHVEVGDTVVQGEPLLSIQSLQLERDLELGTVSSSRDGIESDGTATVAASVDGTVSELAVTEGGFASGGSILATIDREDSLYVEAEFILSARDFARIEENARVEILLPDQRVLYGTVEEINVETVDGDAQATVRITSPDLIEGDSNGLVRPGTPLTAILHLRDDGPLAGVKDAYEDFKRKLGL
jgi:multidrug resistance efflux pump